MWFLSFCPVTMFLFISTEKLNEWAAIKAKRRGEKDNTGFSNSTFLVSSLSGLMSFFAVLSLGINYEYLCGIACKISAF